MKSYFGGFYHLTIEQLLRNIKCLKVSNGVFLRFSSLFLEVFILFFRLNLWCQWQYDVKSYDGCGAIGCRNCYSLCHFQKNGSHCMANTSKVAWKVFFLFCPLNGAVKWKLQLINFSMLMCSFAQQKKRSGMVSLMNYIRLVEFQLFLH